MTPDAKQPAHARRRSGPATLNRTEHSSEGLRFLVYDSRDGSDTTFVLLHGIGLSHRSFLRLADRLIPHGRVIAFDLPGFGGSPRPRRRLAVSDYARVIGAVLEGLGVASVVAVGHSMGAQFALELALQHPDLVDRVVLIGPVTDPERRTALQQGLALARDSLREPLTTNLMVFTDYLRCGPRWYLTEITAMLGYPTHERINALTQPLLVLRGARDPIAKRAWCIRLATAVGHGVQRSLPGRHVVIHTAAESVGDEVLRFATVRPTAA